MAKKEKLMVIPLGGLGEIGKNMTVIQYGSDIIVISAGLLIGARVSSGSRRAKRS